MKLVSRMIRVGRRTFLIACVAGAISPVAALAQAKPAGVPVPEDSPLFVAFKQLDKLPAYRVMMSVESKDPQIAQMAAMGMGLSPAETVVKGGARQVTMHMKMPAMDKPGTIDDWEIRAVVQNGRGARLITSPAVPRLMKLSEQMLAMEMQMFDRQAGVAMAQAVAEGPFGAIHAAMIGGVTAMANIEAPRLLKKEKDFFSWQCMPQLAGGGDSGPKTNQLTDLRLLGDESVGAVSATAYEFYARDGDQLRGPIHLLVAKETGLPLRIEMTEPEMNGRVRMDYSYDNIGDIEIPACMGGTH